MILLSVLVPGGPIETRDFSHINPSILGAFNIFLTSIGIVSLSIILFVLKNKKWALLLSVICGISYFAIYLLDLGKIFPVSPIPMPLTLLIIEIIGTIVSIPLTYLSAVMYFKNKNEFESKVKLPKYFVPLIFLLLIIGIGIVIFATNAAMGK